MKKSEIKKFIKKTVKAEFDKLVSSGEIVELKDLVKNTPPKKTKPKSKKKANKKAAKKAK